MKLSALIIVSLVCFSCLVNCYPYPYERTLLHKIDYHLANVLTHAVWGTYAVFFVGNKIGEAIKDNVVLPVVDKADLAKHRALFEADKLADALLALRDFAVKHPEEVEKVEESLKLIEEEIEESKKEGEEETTKAPQETRWNKLKQKLKEIRERKFQGRVYNL